MLLNLPSELVREVLCNLSGNANALVSCSLTCKGLYLPSQTYLFSRVELHLYTTATGTDMTSLPLKESRSKEDRLLKVLEARPEFIPFVHDVSIYDLFGGEELQVADPDFDSGTIQSSFEKNDGALAVLSRLKSARRLMIFAYNTKSWAYLNPEIQTAIFQAFQFPEVQKIDIHAMSAFPIPLLEYCTKGLKHVSVSTIPTLRLAYTSDSLPTRPENSDLVQLKSLALSTSTPDLERLVEWIPTSRLRLNQLERLVIRTLGDKHKGVQPLVGRLVGDCAATLRELDFFAYLPYGRTMISSDSIRALYDAVNLGRLVALRKLTIRYWLSNISDTNGQLSLLARLLRPIQGAAVLEDIVLNFVVVHTHVPVQYPGGVSNWGVLDTVIYESAPSSLRKISVQFESLSDQARCEVTEMVGNALSRLGSRYLLDIQSSCSPPGLTPFSR